jgi:transposase-like protein
VLSVHEDLDNGSDEVDCEKKPLCNGLLKEMCSDLKAIYTAPTVDSGILNLEAFADKWDKKYEYISRNWLENLEYLSSFWSYPNEIRRLIYTTNPIESFNRCSRKVTKNKPTFPSEDALMKSLYLGIRRLEKNGRQKSMIGVQYIHSC